MNNGMQCNDVGDAFGRSTDPAPSPTQLIQEEPTQLEIYYNMNHSKRGIALIFNHEFFTVPHFEPRYGTNVDCENLTLTLRNLGFEVNAFHNLLHKDVVKQLEKVAKMDHSKHDCLVIAVLSHGELGLLYANDTAYKADSLWDYFTADKCQTLAGKPKLFFIQACQGDKLDPGINLKQRTERDELVPTFHIPNIPRIQADFLIAYSTIPGYYSWRNPTNGSWFIKTLCMELRDNGTRYHLLILLTLVCQRVALSFESYKPDNMVMHQQKQIPCITTKLTRLVKFTSPRNKVVQPVE